MSILYSNFGNLGYVFDFKQVGSTVTFHWIWYTDISIASRGFLESCGVWISSEQYLNIFSNLNLPTNYVGTLISNAFCCFVPVMYWIHDYYMEKSKIKEQSINLCRVVSLWAEIWTQDSLNTKQECWLFSCDFV
jgi:hypothetical protein